MRHTLLWVALLLGALALAGLRSPSPEDAGPTVDLTGLWMMDFRAMDEHPRGVEFLSNWGGQAMRYMAFREVLEFLPDGRFSFDSGQFDRFEIVREANGAIRVCRLADARAPQEPYCLTFEPIDEHRMLITETYGLSGVILRRVSDFSIPTDSPLVAAKFDAMRGNWIVDVAMFQKTDWFRSLPEEPREVYEFGPLGVRRLEVRDGAARCFYVHESVESEPYLFITRPLGLTFDGGLIVRFESPESPQMNLTAVVRPEEPDLIWLCTGLEAMTPFRRAN